MTIVSSIIRFYVDGFRRMTLGKTLWAIILVKLFVLFAIVKVFLLPNHLNSVCDTAAQKSDYVADQLTATAAFSTEDSGRRTRDSELTELQKTTTATLPDSTSH